jgi:radical SAM superfamily enzyme YgiQ (UPF0313 family)
MKILLVNPPFLPKYSRASRSPAVTKSGTIYYPTWLAYATGVLEQAGHDVRLIDCPASGLDTEQLLAAARTELPGLVVMDTSTPSFHQDIVVARAVKEVVPDAFLVMVGTHVSAEPEAALAEASVDAVALGEYDYTLRDLSAALQGGGDIAQVSGLACRKEGAVVRTPPRPYIEDLDALPFISRVIKDHLDLRQYFYAHLQYPMVSIFTSRGCPARCVWCMYPQVFYGHAFRQRSPENVAEEFRYITRELPSVREVLIDDDTFTIDIPRVRRTCELLIEQGNRLPWTCEVRVNNLDQDTMRLMKRAGCRLLVAGFESGNAQILKNIKKGTTPEQGRRFARDAKAAGILVHGCFVAGQPGETATTLQETLDYALSLELDTAQFFPMMLYPGTEAFEWASRNQYLETRDYRKWLTPDGLHATVINLPGLSHDALVRWCDDARRRFYLRPGYIARKLWQSMHSLGELTRTVKSARRFARHLFRNSAAS